MGAAFQPRLDNYSCTLPYIKTALRSALGAKKEWDSIRLRQCHCKESGRKSQGSKFNLQCFKEIKAILFRKFRPRAEKAFRDGLVSAFFFRQHLEDIQCIFIEKFRWNRQSPALRRKVDDKMDVGILDDNLVAGDFSGSPSVAGFTIRTLPTPKP